jgi:diamine N-acetyltransferase
MLKGKHIYLRQLEQEDANLILMWENDSSNWKVSDTEAPFSLLQIQKYIENASNVRQNKQLRLMICEIDSNQAVGTIDLYTIHFKHKRAGVGVLIADKINRNKGFANEAIRLLEKFAKEKLKLQQLYCEVQSTNEASIQLFSQLEYQHVGTRKNWYLFENDALDLYFYQKFI